MIRGKRREKGEGREGGEIVEKERKEEKTMGEET